MKVCTIQPGYSTDYSKSEFYFNEQLKLIDLCDESMDIIVLPESTDIPCLAESNQESEISSTRYTNIILKKASETAERCNSIVFVNARSYEESPDGRNTTWAFDRKGKLVGKNNYFLDFLKLLKMPTQCERL